MCIYMGAHLFLPASDFFFLAALGASTYLDKSTPCALPFYPHDEDQTKWIGATPKR